MTRSCLHFRGLHSCQCLEVFPTDLTMILPCISLLLLLAVSLLAQKKPADFCDPKWCPNQGRHIACNNNGSFGLECSGMYWMEDLNPYKELILRLHNEARNKIGLGIVPRFRPAVRMPVMRWDKKLTIMAELNVKTCHFEHDECRSTSEFPYCGQNIYFAKTTFTNYTIVNFIEEAVAMWFDEHKDANMQVINCFKLTEPQSGHFTAMCSDRNDRIGCGYLHSVVPRRKRKSLHMIIFTCNYPSTNIMDVPVYKAGPAASECRRPHYVYKGLCAQNEVIDPNNFTWYGA